MQDNVYENDDLVDVYQDSNIRLLFWMKRVIWILSVALPCSILLLARGYNVVIAFMAYLNCLLYTLFAMHFLKKQSLTTIIPVIAPLWLVVGSCLGVIYYAMFSPERGYEVEAGYFFYLQGGIKYQFVIFLFLSVYFLFMALYFYKPQHLYQRPDMCTSNIGFMGVIISVPILLLSAVGTIIDFPETIKLWSNRLFVYFQSILFLVGFGMSRLSKPVKTILISMLGFVIILFSLRGSRGMALVPLASLMTAILLFSEVKTKTKKILIVLVCIGLPLLMFAGETVRAVLGGSAGAELASLETRIEALKDWKSVAKEQGVLSGFFGRMFFSAGNVIVSCMPDDYPYRGFSPLLYIKEFFLLMLPEQLLRPLLDLGPDKLGYELRTNYSGTFLLNDYGIHVDQGTSVEVSTVGHFWMLGGYGFIVLGGFLVASLHAMVAKFINHVWTRDPDKAMFYFAVLFYSILWCMNWDFIQMNRFFFLSYLYAFISYKLIKPFLVLFYKI